MPARSKARKRALDVLFEAEAQGVAPSVALARRVDAADPPVNDYTVTLVEGVTAHRERIDELLATYARGWTLERMPAVDRNVLRLGAYELLVGDVPAEVVLDEATSLVAELSTDESPDFVHGLLGRLRDLGLTLAP
ncbi:transcription antitermination factor NusB [Vallicoccus soli]|uniref:Transcription antitermination protein NusB n=1 Tax=Vallicoccus soli TaxID=2339232 RepID=A0A3A3Z4V5_9ACTN|nr:transcription antitermination factor NusB [Vallicoccus soli]RJK96758.1 transcription antitermination factor NusB [Vallicoccus soli]